MQRPCTRATIEARLSLTTSCRRCVSIKAFHLPAGKSSHVARSDRYRQYAHRPFALGFIVSMRVGQYCWGSQQQQVLLPPLLACTNLVDSTRCLLPCASACHSRHPLFVRANSCRPAAPTQHAATGPAESSIVTAAVYERARASGGSGRPSEDQLQPASPAKRTETLMQPHRPARLRSKPSDSSPPPAAQKLPRDHVAQPTPASQRQQGGGGSRRGRRRMTPEQMARGRSLARNVELVASKDAEEVLAIVEKQLDAFNDVNAVTAFHRLARVCARMLRGSGPAPSLGMHGVVLEEMLRRNSAPNPQVCPCIFKGLTDATVFASAGASYLGYHLSLLTVTPVARPCDESSIVRETRVSGLAIRAVAAPHACAAVLRVGG